MIDDGLSNGPGDPDETEPPPPTAASLPPPGLSPRMLLALGVPGELSLAGIASLLGLWFFSDPIPYSLRIEWKALWQTAASTAPLVVFAAVATSRWGLQAGPLRGIHDRIRDVIGPTLLPMRFWQLFLLALAAGIGEETLFRGILHERFGIWMASAVFGILHALTPTYAVLAFLMSLYLGWLYDGTDNLLVPIGVHALYDAAALVLLRARFRSPV